MKLLRDIRVIPVVLVAIAGLAELKVAGLFVQGGYVFDYKPHSTKRSWEQDTFNFPTGKNESEITGSVETPKEEAVKTTAASTETARPYGTVVYPEQNQ